MSAVGNTGDFIYDYYIYPIEAHAGYNVVNTLTYASLALISLLVIYSYFKKKGWSFDAHFFKSLVPFVLFGSVKRVITDAVYAGALQGGIYGLYEWNIFNVTPGIYIFTALLFLGSFILEKIKGWNGLSEKFGWLLVAFHLLILIPAIKYWDRGVPIILLAGIAYLAGSFFFRGLAERLAVFGQGFDGATTFVAIELFGYGEQHVLSRFIGENFGYVAFYLIKVILSIAILYYVSKEAKDEEEKNLITYAVFVIGMAPGLRSFLRLISGV